MHKEIPWYKIVWVKKASNVNSPDTMQGGEGEKGGEEKSQTAQVANRFTKKGKIQSNRKLPENKGFQIDEHHISMPLSENQLDDAPSLEIRGKNIVNSYDNTFF